MKKFKKIMSMAFALFAFCFLFTNVITVHAEEKKPGKVYVEPVLNAKGKWKDTTKMRILTDEMDSFEVEYGVADSIKNLKVNKKGLTAAVTYSYSGNMDYEDRGYSRISLYSTKPGKYTVSFNVVDAAGKSLGKKKMIIQVVHTTALIKKATFGKQTIVSHAVSYKNGAKKTVNKYTEKVTGSAGKLKITANSQYKITGLIVRYVDKNGKYVYKKINNGGNLTLSKTYGSVSRSTSGSSRSSKKYTDIWISYKDTFTGDTCKCSVVKNRGIKEVKRVYKTKLTGISRVQYSPYQDISLWQY